MKIKKGEKAPSQYSNVSENISDSRKDTEIKSTYRAAVNRVGICVHQLGMIQMHQEMRGTLELPSSQNNMSAEKYDFRLNIHIFGRKQTVEKRW